MPALVRFDPYRELAAVRAPEVKPRKIEIEHGS